MASNEIDKEQEKAIDLRPNYFAGQYLLEDDFLLEQKYHIDRQRRHNRLLHVSGIAEGLNVSPGEDKKVKVSAGTAIDSQGRQIILPDAQSVELEEVANTNPLKDGEYTLSIRYEELTEKQDSEESMARRVQEKPKFELSKSTTPDVIPLAKLTIKGGKVENEENIDRSVRQYSGICLPTEDGNGVTLRSQGAENPNLAILTGSLSISGKLAVIEDTELKKTLTVKGNTTIEQELKVKSLFLGETEKGVTLRSPSAGNSNVAEIAGSLSISGTLTVQEKKTFLKDLDVTGNLNLKEKNGTLTVTGATILSDTTIQTDIEVNGCLTYNKIKGTLFGNWEEMKNKTINAGGKELDWNEYKDVDKIYQIDKTATTDGFVVAWIRAYNNGDRGSLEVYVGGNKVDKHLRGLASVHYFNKEDKQIRYNSTTVPVKKGEQWILNKWDTSGICDWRVYWISLGNT